MRENCAPPTGLIFDWIYACYQWNAQCTYPLQGDTKSVPPHDKLPVCGATIPNKPSNSTRYQNGIWARDINYRIVRISRSNAVYESTVNRTFLMSRRKHNNVIKQPLNNDDDTVSGTNEREVASPRFSAAIHVERVRRTWYYVANVPTARSTSHRVAVQF